MVAQNDCSLEGPRCEVQQLSWIIASHSIPALGSDRSNTLLEANKYFFVLKYLRRQLCNLVSPKGFAISTLIAYLVVRAGIITKHYGRFCFKGIREVNICYSTPPVCAGKTVAHGLVSV